MSTDTLIHNALAEKTDDQRLKIYKMLISGCNHLYSKNKLVQAKFNDLASVFADLAKNDPIFLAHLAAWAFKQENKDLKVLSLLFNSLSDADGTPFFKGSEENKPNFRIFSAYLLQELDPHLALRVLELHNTKFGVEGVLNNARHYPTSMKTAYKKYLRFREKNIKALESAKKGGFSSKLKSLYIMNHLSPSDDAAIALGWKQKLGLKDSTKEYKSNLPDFSSMKSADIATYVQENKLGALVCISSIPKSKITTSVAKAILGNCTGNQAIILQNWFVENGFMETKSIKELFHSKVKDATTAIDRIDTLSTNMSAEDKEVLSDIRSNKRKQSTANIGLDKIYIHIDISPSMKSAIEYAKENAKTFAECIDDPHSKMRIGVFNDNGTEINMPKATKYTKEYFHKILYGLRTSGMTNCVALYEKARNFGATVDVYITDQDHNVGAIATKIQDYHKKNPTVAKPVSAIIIDFSNWGCSTLKTGLESSGIPVTVVSPSAHMESALVSQSIANAIKGELVLLDEIFNTPLPRKPKWWDSI